MPARTGTPFSESIFTRSRPIVPVAPVTKTVFSMSVRYSEPGNAARAIAILKRKRDGEAIGKIGNRIERCETSDMHGKAVWKVQRGTERMKDLGRLTPGHRLHSRAGGPGDRPNPSGCSIFPAARRGLPPRASRLALSPNCPTGS